MSLSARLSNIAPPGMPALPTLSLITATCGRIHARWPDVVAEPAVKDREVLVQEMCRRVEQNAWRDAKLSRVTSAARALFDTERRNREDLASLREFYFSEIKASTRKAFLSAMFSVFLASYEPGAAHTTSLSLALRSVQHRLNAKWQKLLRIMPECLDAVGAHIAIAARMLRMANPWLGLKAIGIQSPHAPGIMDFAHLEFVKRLQPQLHERPTIDKLLEWLGPVGKEARMSGAAEAVAAILDPWVDSPPPQDVAEDVFARLVDMYGDPRVQRGGIWGSISARAKTAIMRWLTHANIKFFLDVVSSVEDSHMWEPRRRFWLELYRAGRIDSAWVAFSRDGAALAKQLSKGDNQSHSLAFGLQTAGGSRTTTSLLILQIGSKIVVEGSHNYKVHIFNRSDDGAPALYQYRYDCETIRLSPFAKAKSHLGGWQQWVMEHI